MGAARKFAAIGESLGQGVDRLEVAAPEPGPLDPRDLMTRDKRSGTISVALIDRDPDQPRQTFDEEGLLLLGESIRSKGQQTPVRVRWVPEAGRFAIIAGERRWRACQAAGIETIWATVIDRAFDAAEVLEEQIVENNLRENPPQAEQARAYERLMALRGWSQHQLSEHIHVPQSSISRTMQLLKLAPEAQDLVDQGEISLGDARDLATVAEPAAQVAAARAMVRERAERKPRAAKAKPNRLVFTPAEGVRITVEHPADMAHDTVLMHLRRAANKK